MVNRGLDTIVVILITLVIGALIGAWQGFWIAYRDVPSFIVTLSSMLLFRGGIIGITGGNSIGPMNRAFKALGQGYVANITVLPFHDTTVFVAAASIIAVVYFAVHRRVIRKRYGLRVLPLRLELARVLAIVVLVCLFFGIMAAYRGMPYSIMILAAIVIIFSFVTQKTTFGRHIYAMGGNKEAARLSGINIRRKTFTVFILMGLLTTVAGMIFTARLNAATPQAGNLFELDAIAACIIGGASIQGGEGTVIGAIIGALVMASLDNGMSLLDLNAMYQYIIKGLILLFAVWIDISTRSKA
jgi:D-xylose transport system permease protein